MSKKQKTGKIEMPSDGAKELASKVNSDPTSKTVEEVTKVEGLKENEKKTVSTNVTPKQVFNTSRVAKAVSSNPSVTAAGRSMFAMFASGSASENGITGDRSGAVSQGTADNPSTRIGKKTLSTARKIRLLVPEQVESDYKTTKPLAGNGSSVQGANGQAFNKHFHSAKTHGSSPADFNFERSLDFITRDEALYSDGQYNVLSRTVLNDSIVVQDSSSTIVDYTYKDTAGYHKVARGNYLPKLMTITITPAGVVTIGIDEDNITPVVTTENELSRASKDAFIHANQAELDRQVMESKAGSWEGENSSPLPMQVANPTGLAAFFAALENSTGTEMLMARAKLNLASSFVLNKAAKDGMNDAVLSEVFNGITRKVNTSSEYAGMAWAGAAAYNAGSSAWLLAMNDTMAKYNYKSDLYVQARGLPLLLNLLEQNLDTFKVRERFASLFYSREMFSTIGSPYDPYLPVFISDVEAVAHPFSLASWLTAGGVPKHYDYSVSEMKQTRTVRLYHPILKGLYDYLTFNAEKIRSVFGTAAVANTTIAVPMFHSTMALSAWSMLLAAASPEITRARISSFYDVNRYTLVNGYPYSGFVNVGAAIKSPYRNLEAGDREEPLLTKIMDSTHAINWVMTEQCFWGYGVDHSTASATTPGDQIYGFVAPWYFDADMFKATGQSVDLKDDVFLMAMPNIRSGATLGALDSLYDQDERSLRLSLDMYVTVPGIHSASGLSVLKHSQQASGQPVLTFTSKTVTVGDIIRTPRELGLSFVLPGDYLRYNFVSPEVCSLFTLASEYDGTTSYVAYVYAQNLNQAPAVNAIDPLVLDETAALKQAYYIIPASPHVAGNEFTHGFHMSLSDAFGTYIDRDGDNTAISILNPYYSVESPIIATDNTQSDIHFLQFASIVKSIWLRIQRLPMALSPWDTAAKPRIFVKGNFTIPTELVDPEDNDYRVASIVSPFEFLYFFGLSGFGSSDFSEDVYNRLNDMQSKGMAFVSDLFHADSPLLK